MATAKTKASAKTKVPAKKAATKKAAANSVTKAAPKSASKNSAKKSAPATKHRVFTMPFARVYPLYVQKAEKKGRTKAEVDTLVTWLTGYDAKGLARVIATQVDFETFFGDAPKLNPKAKAVTGVVCGVRVEDVPDPLMRKIRILDKMVDELARGKSVEKILRS
ncbi:MAG: DUF2200 domain-containing protein [Polyangiaceae bacterium]